MKILIFSALIILGVVLVIAFRPSHEPTNLYDQINRYVQKDTTVSVYFRPEFGEPINFNAEEKYAPGSLLKVPLLFAYLKASTITPSILETKLVYDGKRDDTGVQTIKPKNPLKPGTYTVDELLNYMIKASDNNALTLLDSGKILKLSVTNRVLNDFDIPAPKTANDQFMTARQYASLFESLLDESYLNAEMSKKALDILTDTDFTDGIASFPKGVRVAHKFGQRGFEDPRPLSQLHDCGIVFHPRQRYVLCVMTKANITTIDPLVEVIKDISKMTYKYVDQQ